MEDPETIWSHLLHSWPILGPALVLILGVTGWLAKRLGTDLIQRFERVVKDLDRIAKRVEDLSQVVNSQEQSIPLALANYARQSDLDQEVSQLLPRHEFDAAHSTARSEHARYDAELKGLTRTAIDHERRIATIEGAHAKKTSD